MTLEDQTGVRMRTHEISWEALTWEVEMNPIFIAKAKIKGVLDPIEQGQDQVWRKRV